ncbi:MAG: DNA polymerase III subunit gamma/tau [Bacteroidota bacterium]|nr:DNA polymerase III subunit gamma/tau [Bacteroidota bacterium]
MENFVVSARKYRPQTFRTVVGQSHITNTLKNAIISKHLAQAFLFCGPRGVGKTTCARILAKTINCFNITSEGEACDTCDSCVSFNSGASLNVYELDAASNNSVEDIRSLIEQVRFAPQLGSHKVYIIDEVHMLSQAAFNAFLKTLEEPPKHAIFILATTEKHKILPTILSRCQIFDFNRIKIEDISSHLAYIAKTEGVAAEEDALHIIAQKADGGLRDACSIFDQMVSFSGNSLTYKAVVENLHVLDYDYYFKITDAMYSGNLSQALLIFDEILKNGFDGHNFIVGLGEHFRNILVCKDPITVQLLEVGSNVKEKYTAQAQLCAMPFLLKSLGIVNRIDVSFKASKNQRLAVELGLMQMSYLNNAASLDAEKKKDELEPEFAPVQQKQAAVPVSNGAPTVVTAATTNKPVTSFKDLDIKSPFRLNELGKSATLRQAQDAVVNTQKEETTITEPITDVPVTEADVQNAVKQYSEEQGAKGKRQVEATLSAKPVAFNNNTISLYIENEAQKLIFDDIKQEFLDAIRARLKNSTLQLNVIEHVDSTVKKAYTPNEKFAVMTAKNPLLLELKKRLDLEVGL